MEVGVSGWWHRNRTLVIMWMLNKIIDIIIIIVII